LVDKTRAIVVVVVVGAVALSATAYFTRGFGLWAPRDAASLTLYGNVDIREVDLGFRVAGRIERMPIEEGARVAAGDLLAALDPRPLAIRLASTVGKMASVKATLAKLQAGNRPQDIASAEADLVQRKATADGARRDYERYLQLMPSGSVTRQVFEQNQAMFLSTQGQVTASEQALSLQRAGTRIEDIDAAKANYATAVAERDAAQADLDDSRLLSPSDGVILTRAREPGAIVAAGETVFALTIDRPMRIRAYVGEPDLGRVAPGMAVSVTTDGGRHVYPGRIGFISPTAEFTPKTVETRSLRVDLVYRLRIIVTEPDDALRQGQPVTVTITQGPRAP